MKIVANGVLVTDACVAAIKDITATGAIEAGIDAPNSAMTECAKGAAAKNRGNMMPPGFFPAQANAIDKSLASPT